MEVNISSKRLLEKEKYANDKQWFKDSVNRLEVFDDLQINTTGNYSRFKNIKINLDLYNGIINKSDFVDIIAPFGEDAGELPANFNNKNIIFSKIRAIEGIELQRHFNFRLIAVNPEATTRKEKKKYEMIQEWVVQNIMQELEQKIRAIHEEEFENIQSQSEETEQLQQIQQELEQRIQEEIIAQTPDEINRYMARHYQDPAEVMFNQILEYESKRLQLLQKLNEGCSYAAQTAIEVYRIYEKNKKPFIQPLNPIGFTFNKSLYSNKIEDSDWASYVYFLKPNEILNEFVKELSQEDVDKIEGMVNDLNNPFPDVDNLDSMLYTYPTQGVRVQHCEWKSMKKIQYLTYLDEDDEPQQVIVEGDYKLDEEIGDLALEEDWVLTKYEGTKIGEDVWVRLREVPGQHGDINNAKECKLSYVGMIYDRGVSIVERLKNYQYLYDILMYRMELQTAKDKGNITAINQDLVPDEIDLPTWMMNAEKSGFALFSTVKEGGKEYPFEVTNAVKEINMSLTSDIDKYRQLAEFVDYKAGESIGVTKSMEGQIQEREAVNNVQQSIVQGTTILQKFFITHDNVKKNVMESLINLAKDIYLRNPSQALYYVLDDLSIAVLEMDEELLETTTLGFFAQDSNLDYQQLTEIRQMSNAALAAGTLELNDVVLMYKAKSVQEADEILKAAQEKRQKREDVVQQQQAKQAQELETQRHDNMLEMIEIQHQNKINEIREKGEIDILMKQIEIERQLVFTSGFDQEKDRNNNQIADYVEYTQKAQKHADEMRLKWEQEKRKSEELKHKKKYDEEKLKLENKKLNKPNNKK